MHMCPRGTSFNDHKSENIALTRAWEIPSSLQVSQQYGRTGGSKGKGGCKKVTANERLAFCCCEEHQLTGCHRHADQPNLTDFPQCCPQICNNRAKPYFKQYIVPDHVSCFLTVIAICAKPFLRI